MLISMYACAHSMSVEMSTRHAGGSERLMVDLAEVKKAESTIGVR